MVSGAAARAGSMQTAQKSQRLARRAVRAAHGAALKPLQA